MEHFEALEAKHTWQGVGLRIWKVLGVSPSMGKKINLIHIEEKTY